MKNSVWKGIILSIVCTIIFLTSTYASEEEKIKFQGKIMNLNLERKMMIVNEGLFVWDEKTVINNHEGSPVTIEKFKPDSWVYIEGEKVKKQIVIRKIYLLPKYIDNKERNRYPFMQ